MESMRDIDRAMERGDSKGELSVKVCEDRFSDFPYQEIASRESC